MKIITLHNYYQQQGGEDVVFEGESALLTRNSHLVKMFCRHNNLIKNMSPLAVAAATIYSRGSYARVRREIREWRPAIAHFHNTFPLISPAAYKAAGDERAAVVQTLHNYRLLCPGALFYRDHHVCEECLGKAVPYPGILHGCYRGNRLATAGVAAMLATHRILRTWHKRVDMYIALTRFARRKFIEGGLPADRIALKPNFVHPDPGPGQGRGGYALFVGRLSEEKGVKILMTAWERLGGAVPLKIVGDGPLKEDVSNFAARFPKVAYLGRKQLHQVHELMGEAYVLVFPSTWYETFGLVAIESFARATPVISSYLGAEIGRAHV